MPPKKKNVKPPKARIEVYRPADGKGWQFRAKGGNSRIIGASEQAVKQKVYQARRAHRQFPDLPVFEVHEDGSLTPYVLA